jgi:hypothetical protein
MPELSAAELKRLRGDTIFVAASDRAPARYYIGTPPDTDEGAHYAKVTVRIIGSLDQINGELAQWPRKGEWLEPWQEIVAVGNTQSSTPSDALTLSKGAILNDDRDSTEIRYALGDPKRRRAKVKFSVSSGRLDAYEVETDERGIAVVRLTSGQQAVRDQIIVTATALGDSKQLLVQVISPSRPCTDCPGGAGDDGKPAAAAAGALAGAVASRILWRRRRSKESGTPAPPPGPPTKRGAASVRLRMEGR